MLRLTRMSTCVVRSGRDLDDAVRSASATRTALTCSSHTASSHSSLSSIQFFRLPCSLFFLVRCTIIAIASSTGIERASCKRLFIHAFCCLSHTCSLVLCSLILSDVRHAMCLDRVSSLFHARAMFLPWLGLACALPWPPSVRLYPWGALVLCTWIIWRSTSAASLSSSPDRSTSTANECSPCFLIAPFSAQHPDPLDLCARHRSWTDRIVLPMYALPLTEHVILYTVFLPMRAGKDLSRFPRGALSSARILAITLLFSANDGDTDLSRSCILRLYESILRTCTPLNRQPRLTANPMAAHHPVPIRVFPAPQLL